MATDAIAGSVSSADGEPILAAAAALRPVIRGYQEEIERERRIPPALMEQLRAAGMYRMLVPRELGGAQLDLVTCFRAIELASEGDGSVGWNIATSSAQALTALSLPDAGVREVFANGPDVPLAGTLGRAGGTTSIGWGQRLERCWRDVQVVGQTFSLLTEFYVLGGKALLGLAPGPRLS